MSACLPFDDCLVRLDRHCDGTLLAGRTAADMLAALLRGERPEPYGEALRTLVDWIPVRRADQPVTRGELVHALGPLRLRHQAQDDDAQAYRALVRLIRAIDAVYDEQAESVAHDSPTH